MHAVNPPRAADVEAAREARARRSITDHTHYCRQCGQTWWHLAGGCVFKDRAVCPVCVGRIVRMQALYV